MSAPARPAGWLFGPWPDLLLGCGLSYAALLPALTAAGPGLALDATFISLLILFVSAPHYGATLLRVYERRADRDRYVVFSVWATLAVVAAVVAGVYERGVAIALYTIYITWSPWHYSGQNYGIAVMLLGRRGVAIDKATKRLLYLSFVASFAVTFLVLHTASSALSYNPNAVPYESAQLAVRPLGIPAAVTGVLLPALLSGYVGCAVAALLRLRRRFPWQDLLPAVALVISQALWFAIPFSVVFFGFRTGIAPFDSVDRYVLWTALAHAAQYLWVTTYYARASSAWGSYSGYLSKALLAGTAVWTLPVIAFAPDWSGGSEYAAGLGLLVAAGVNIHHFILDGAIWKLRNTRIASVLIRASREEPEAATAAAPRQRWLGLSVWSICGIALALALATTWWETRAFTTSLRTRDFSAAERILDRLAWLGHDSSKSRVHVARGWVKAGKPESARTQLERSIALAPSVVAWTSLARLAVDRKDWSSAVHAYREALLLDPDRRSLLNDLAWVLATADDAAVRDPDEAVRLAEQALHGQQPPDPNYVDTLAVAYEAAGRSTDAVATAARAVELAREQGLVERTE